MSTKKHTAEYYITKIQPHVAYCTNCQPRDDGEYIWILGIQCEMNDFLCEHDVPEDLWEIVAEGLHCNSCYTQLNLGYDVGIKDMFEIKADKRWKKWQSIYEPELEQFVEYMSKYPYLGCHNRVGRKIMREIDKFPVINISNEKWYRAREPDGSKSFSSIDMDPPMAGPKSEGRFNHYGQRVLYMASTKEAAACEILKDNQGIVWIQKYLVREANYILDLYSHHNAQDEDIPILALGLNSFVEKLSPKERDSPWKPQYFLPRFIADCAREKGLNGIIFGSWKHYARNLVIFQWDKADIHTHGKPSILHFDKDKYEGDQPF